MKNHATIIRDLMDKYCSSSTTSGHLIQFVHDCLKKSMKFELPKNFQDEIKYEDCTINYDLDLMIFSLFKFTNFEKGETYEIHTHVSSYLDRYYGIPKEDLIKNLFFSDLEIGELASDIAKDIKEWCHNVETVYDNAPLL